jgi:hypothetical protein
LALASSRNLCGPTAHVKAAAAFTITEDVPTDAAAVASKADIVTGAAVIASITKAVPHLGQWLEERLMVHLRH